MNFIYKAAPLGELSDYDEKNSIVKGYGSYFDNKDADDDVIMRGADRDWETKFIIIFSVKILIF